MIIEKSEILFVINPKAGKRNIDFILKSIRKIDNNIKYIITDNLSELENEINKKFGNYKVFVAVGGDGTVNSLMKYLINQNDKALAVLPLGSGNGFANELGFKFDIENLIKDISRGETLEIDVLEINKNSFINLAGIGLDAVIAHDFQESETRGFFNYIISTINSYFSFKPFKASITGNDINVDGTFQMISIANTRQFGNNVLISPTSKPDDGKFEVVLLKPIPIFSLLPFVFRLFKGNLRNSNYIEYISCVDSISIISDCDKYHIDGDPLFSDGNYKITINKKCLKILKTQQKLLYLHHSSLLIILFMLYIKYMRTTTTPWGV